MFENNGAPTGYNQIQPGLDQPRQTPPGRPGRPPSAGADSPLQSAIVNPVAPAYPTDPGFLQWRQAAKPQGQGAAALQGIGGQQAPGAAALQGIIGSLGGASQGASYAPSVGGAPSTQTGVMGGGSMMGGGSSFLPTSGPSFPGAGASATRQVGGAPQGAFHPAVPQQQAPTQQPAQGASSFGNLSDPSAWMGMVGNKDQLSQWVTQGLGHAAAKPGLVDYYVLKIQGQPGANAHEQAGSAQYWMEKMQNDPNVTGHAAQQAQRLPRFNSGGGNADPSLTNPALMQAVLYGQGQQPTNYLQQMMQQQQPQV